MIESLSSRREAVCEVSDKYMQYRARAHNHTNLVHSTHGGNIDGLPANETCATDTRRVLAGTTVHHRIHQHL